MSAAYASGGDQLSLIKLYRNIDTIKLCPLEDSGGYVFEVTDTNWAAPGATGNIKILCMYCDYNGVNGPFIEAAGDLSTIYFRIEILGVPA